MKQALLTVSVVLATMLAVTASPWNKKTNIEVKETILIPGKQLPPGKYVMKLVDSDANRHIVQILNEEENKVEATILAIPNSRLQPTGDTVLSYWETPSGSPPALRSWFYPGDSFGQEFAYPKAMAEQIAAANRTKVPWYEGSDEAEYEATALRETKVYDFDESAMPSEAREGEAASGVEKPSEHASEHAAVQEGQSQSTTTAQSSEAPSDPAVTTETQATQAEKSEPAPVAAEAQNGRTADTQSTPAPQAEPAPLAADQERERSEQTFGRESTPQNGTPQNGNQAAEHTEQSDTLPRTATPYGALMLAGIALVSVAGRMMWKKR